MNTFRNYTLINPPDSGHKPFNKGIKVGFSGVLLGGNIINKLPGSCLVDNIAVCLCFYPQTINIKHLFVHMFEKTQSICKWCGQVRQLGHVYCLH